MTTNTGADVFNILNAIGFTDYLIPFILVWTALYAVTMKIKVPSERADLNAIISFTIAYIFTAFGGGQMVNAILPSFMILFLVLLIILLFYSFIGAKPESIAKAFSNPGIVLMIIILLVILTFTALQDWMIVSDRIPAWQVNESGELIVENRIGGSYPANITQSTGDKPNRIVVDGQEYELIEGIYYKQGYEGAAYALGQPEVIAGMFILIILGVAVALIVWPKN